MRNARAAIIAVVSCASDCHGRGDEMPTYIVDYDLRMVHNSARRQFYRSIQRFLKDRNVAPETWSTQSVLVTEDLEFAEFVYGLASELGHANIYKGERIK